MDCFVAASTGALKTINLRDNVFTNLNAIKTLLPKKDEVTSMIWDGSEQVALLTAQLDRQLKLFHTETSQQSTLFSIDGGVGPVKGLHMTPSEDIISCVESGMAKIWTREGKEKTSWNVGEGITAMRGSDDRKEIVTGGIKNLVKTWDMETGKQTWGAKNVPPDFLQLEVPIMCTDVRFVPGQHLIIEATKLHEMRVYDTRAQRRPIRKIPFMDVPLTALSLCHREHHVLAANSIGEMGLFDIRSKVHPVCKYKGQAGSIRSIDAHPTSPYVATCGIDRFVRVHDVDSKKLVHKIYCKTRLNRVLMRKDLSILNKLKKEETDEQDWDMIKDEDRDDSDGSESGTDDSDEASDGDVWEKIASGEEDDEGIEVVAAKKNQRKRREGDKEEVPEPTKKKRVEKGRKRKEEKDEGIKDEIELSDDEEPVKKAKLTKTKKSAKSKVPPVEEVEVKEEVDSDSEPVPMKKRRVTRKSKKL